VVSCNPPVHGQDAMLAELNRTNNLSKFVRDVRRAFRSAMLHTGA
jgi:hypothetical protein